MGCASQNTTSKLTGAVLIVSAIAILSTLAIPYIGDHYGNSGPKNLYHCEKHTIRQCDAKTSHPGVIDCLFTNNSRDSVTSSKFIIWNYDSEGIVTGTNKVLTDMVAPPGETVHIEFFTDKYAHESVICSMDPESPHITRSTWTVIANSDG